MNVRISTGENGKWVNMILREKIFRKICVKSVKY